MVLLDPIDLRANPPDGDKGDITVSGGGTTFTIDPNAVTNAQLAQMPAGTIKGNLGTVTANAQDVTLAALGSALANEITFPVWELTCDPILQAEFGDGRFSIDQFTQLAAAVRGIEWES
jgi:hypothetical protein